MRQILRGWAHKEDKAMDMKETTRIEVIPAEVDQTGHLPPRRLMQLLVLAGMDRNRVEGGSRTALRERFGAAWMLRRIRLRQILPIKAGEILQGYGSGRTMLEAEYVIRGEFRKNGELAARCDMVMMPVTLAQRVKLKPAEVECLYTTQPLNEVGDFPRLEMYPDFPYTTEKQITTSDCDENANHFASHNYADLVCRETGYWEGEYHMMKMLQIDYVKECKTDDFIKLGARPNGAGYSIQGIHANGKPCFNAYCEYE